MMHAVHDGVSAGIQEGSALGDKRHHVKSALPAFAGGEHLMRGVPVKKEGLEKKGKEPVRQEKIQYDHGYSLLKSFINIRFFSIRGFAASPCFFDRPLLMTEGSYIC
jgi:hypothetical protein